jgi:hypothetical protein
MELVEKLKNCVKNACREESKIDSSLISITGFPGVHYRHFINNLFSGGTWKMLEIGGHNGITAASAMSNSKGILYSTSNWSEIGFPKAIYSNNVEPYKKDTLLTEIDSDPWYVDPKTYPKIDIYIYGGYYDPNSNYQAVNYSLECCADSYIYVCHNWNMPPVREGVRRALKELPINVLYEDEIRLTFDDTPSPSYIADKTWSNGVYMAVFTRKEASLSLE